MKLTSVRLMYFYAFLGIILMFALALYLEYVKGITPCPLCMLQRFVAGILGVLFFLGFAFPLKKFGNSIISILGFLFSILGAFLAGRQVWIQHLPATQTPDCGVSLDYLLRVLPLDQAAKKILEGSAECSLVNWTFYNLSLAEWSLIWFIIFALFALWQTFRRV